MIIEISFAVVGGLNFGLERSWNRVKDILTKYPSATWKKILNRKGEGKYIVEIK
jgi:hypothetical protein